MTIYAKNNVVINGKTFQKTLAGHTQDVLAASNSLFGNKEGLTRLGEQWLSFFRLPKTHRDFFARNLKAAVILHDIGKSNNHFQNAILFKSRQTLRHEFIGGWVIGLPFFREIFQFLNLDFPIIRASVMGHHLKLDHDILSRSDYANPFIQILPEGINDVLNLFLNEFDIQQPSKILIPSQISIQDDKIVEDFDSLEKELRSPFPDKNPEHFRCLRAVRSALILADAGGSGLAREMNKSVHAPLSQWIEEAFEKKESLSAEKIEHDIIEPRCRQILSGKKASTFAFSDFQIASASLPERTCLLASCGSGKTLAAWKWGSGIASRKHISRFIFLYPTRATATEGFRDYVSWAPETDGALLHGTSAYELQYMFDNPEDPRVGKDFLSNDRLFAVGLWQKKIFSATVDQFLGFLGHDYRSSCLLPVMADSALVFDEIHSYDTKLFSSLLGFLREFDVPALCMTASLPINRLEQLREAGLTIFPEGLAFPDLEEKATIPRYRVKKSTKEFAFHEALEAYEKGEKVLWVVNTVKRCQELTGELQMRLPEGKIYCYHSRFRLMDRQNRHKNLIAKFRDSSPMIAVTTQVCEMSLDLSASLLISEFAPLTALIQRMGRCNRFLEAAPDGSNSLGHVLLYPPDHDLPYSKDDMEHVVDFVQEINERTVSQKDLQILLEKFSPNTREMEKLLPFLCSNAFASSLGGNIRDIEGYTVPSILEKDAETFLKLRKNGKPADGYILPASFKSTQRDSRLPPYLNIAQGNYDEYLGYSN